MQTVTLYAVPHSVYAGRARSYLIKAGIPYREKAPNSDHFAEVVLPKAGGRNSMPTVELENGDVVRDGAAIIDHFEEQNGEAFSPKTPKQRFVSRLFDVIGAEGFNRPFMHYRWNFDDENLDFLTYHFEMIVGKGEGRAGVRDFLMGAMRKATVSFGVTPDTIPVIEAVYADQLAALETHFLDYGYLLGGRPCIGDFALMVPFFGHLGRDPKALSLLQRDAKAVFRFSERMNRLAADLVEYENQDEAYLAGDEIPGTLVDVMRAIAEDFVPETLAAADAINAWLEEKDVEAGSKCPRSAGMAEFEVRGTKINAIAQPYRFYLLKRAQDEYAAMGPDDRQAMDAILEASNMAPVLEATLTRKIGRANNLEVWL
ncbi:MAG: glutathione S-transferase N-terminal domain-containing protein [Pseudomonadota bacterium]